MKILIACEESQRVCVEFRGRGHEAFSCDILDTSGSHPEWHIKGDVVPLLKEKWDMIIAFPPCTYLTTTGNRWFDVEKYGEKAKARFEKRKEAIDFFMKIATADCEKIAIENPVGIMSTVYRKPDQIIQPYYFGDPYEKRTCLWLKNLPLLKPTKIVMPPPRIKYPSGKSMPVWYSKLWGNAKERSKTFYGIAKAMAEQWSGIVTFGIKEAPAAKGWSERDKEKDGD